MKNWLHKTPQIKNLMPKFKQHLDLKQEFETPSTNKQIFVEEISMYELSSEISIPIEIEGNVILNPEDFSKMLESECPHTLSSA
eukprot:CAMPEP_0205815234 /NCGR_PEP_ID=MMETSP0205-20121125/20847_1 /ASSEMBLY_ACC=CAM_ASM_000278 /TAXON_ID=36767 /ORGANISM="Euplotes focardii, Strain TN1" /LENGTH=83 /DNA_ID=CAMNT_0053101027 /DNA_START=160 /DNA_END=407 /DNA_ORIENTATION=-